MKGFTRVFLVGYLGQNPELQKSKGGASYIRLSVSTHKSKKLADGKWDNSTEWHRVIVWGTRAELCAKKLSKGSPLAIEGHLETYKMEREGGPVALTTVIAEQVHFLPNPRQQKLFFEDESASENISNPPDNFETNKEEISLSA